MVEVRRQFNQVYWDYERSFTARERMAILRAIALLKPEINYMDINHRQAVFKHVSNEMDLASVAKVEIKVGCNWIQVSTTDNKLTLHITEKIQEAIKKANKTEG